MKIQKANSSLYSVVRKTFDYMANYIDYDSDIELMTDLIKGEIEENYPYLNCSRIKIKNCLLEILEKEERYAKEWN